MCQVEKDGYRMNDGTLIRFDESPENIPVAYINELNDNAPSAWDSFQLHRQITCMEEKILSTLSDHGKYCPLNQEGIGRVVDERIEARKDNKVIKIRETARDVLLLLTITSLIITMVSVFGK